MISDEERERLLGDQSWPPDPAREVVSSTMPWARPGEMPLWVSWGMRCVVRDEPTPLVDILVALNLAESRGDARRAIRASEVAVGGVKIQDTTFNVPVAHLIVTRGKQRAGRVVSSPADLPLVAQIRLGLAA